jgi:hypothetical protein
LDAGAHGKSFVEGAPSGDPAHFQYGPAHIR